MTAHTGMANHVDVTAHVRMTAHVGMTDHVGMTEKVPPYPSFPRKRESSIFALRRGKAVVWQKKAGMDSRFHGNDRRSVGVTAHAGMANYVDVTNHTSMTNHVDVMDHTSMTNHVDVMDHTSMANHVRMTVHVGMTEKVPPYPSFLSVIPAEAGIQHFDPAPRQRRHSGAAGIPGLTWPRGSAGLHRAPGVPDTACKLL